MSTYLPGVTDTGFNPIKYTPNFPYLVDALERMQAKYDANYDDIVDSYKGINKKLSNSDNVAFRDQLLTKTKEQLKKLSSTDLSIASNANEAEKIFAPYWEDQELLQDYTITQQNELATAQYNRLKDSDKKEDRDRAWDYGKSYADLSIQELKIAKRGDGSILKVNPRPYIPLINVSAEISKELKDRGYDEKSMTKVVSDNGYLYEITNGEGSKEIYEKVVSEILAERPDLQEIFKVQGAVDFQGTVNNTLLDAKQKGKEIKREDAVLLMKQKYSEERVKQYNTQINKNKVLLEGSDKQKGLLKELQEKESKALLDLGTGVIKEDNQIFADIRAMYKTIEDMQSTIGYYESSIKDLTSDDFLKNSDLQKSEYYFTNIIRDNFIDGYALTKSLNYRQKAVSDATYISAKNLDKEYAELNLRMQQFQAELDGTLPTSGGGTTSKTRSGRIGVDTKEDELKPNVIPTDVPTVGALNTTSTFFKTSEYDHMVFNKLQYADQMRTAGVSLIQSGINSMDVPGISRYVDYLIHYATGKEDKPDFKDAEIKQTFEVLKTKGILDPTVKNYSDQMYTQLDNLVNYADKSIVSKQGTLPLDQITNRLIYLDSAKKYIETKKVLDGFEQDYAKRVVSKDYANILKKDNNGRLRFIDENDVKNVKLYQQTPINIENGLNQQPILEYKLSDDFVKNYLNGNMITRTYENKVTPGVLYRQFNPPTGSGNARKYNYLYKDGNTQQLLNVTELIYKYGTPEELTTKKQNFEKEKSGNLNDYVKRTYGKDVNNFVMSKSLIYRNDFQGADDKAYELAVSAINSGDPSGKIEKGGFIVPINFDKIYENLSSDSKLSKEVFAQYISKFVADPSALRYYLEQSEITYSGKDKDKAGLIIKLNEGKAFDQLKAILPNDTQKGVLSEVLLAIKAAGGLEYNLDRNVFLGYAKDNYISSVVSENMLKDGYKSSDWEDENLHYRMSISNGSNNTFQLTLQTKSYDPITKEYSYEPEVNKTFSKEIGLDEVLRIGRSAAMNNAIIINNYKRDEVKKNKNNPYAQKTSESFDEWMQRLKQEQNIK